MRKNFRTFALFALFGTCWIAHAQSQPVTPPQRVSGKVVRVEGNTLFIQPRKASGAAEPVAVQVNEHARIFLDMELAPFTDLTAGMDLTTDERGNDKEHRLYIFAFSPSLLGDVVRVDGNRISVNIKLADESTTEVIVETSDATKIHTLWEGGAYWPDRGLIKVSELQPGMRLKAIPATGVARKIFVVTRLRPDQATTQPAK